MKEMKRILKKTISTLAAIAVVFSGMPVQGVYGAEEVPDNGLNGSGIAAVSDNGLNEGGTAEVSENGLNDGGMAAVSDDRLDGGVTAAVANNGLNGSGIVSIPIDTAHFKDEGFARYVRELLDYDENGVLDVGEIEDVDHIFADTKYNIKSLEGIENFPNLLVLFCNDVSLGTLDVSHNARLRELSCVNTGLKTLDVSHNQDLEELYCADNDFAGSGLDVSGNPNLTNLGCSNCFLTKLDVSGNSKLQSLDCSSNVLSVLDVNHNSKLQSLWCGHNCLTILDLTGNTNLTYLGAYDQNPDTKAVLRPDGTVSLQEIVGKSNLSRVTVDSFYGVYNAATGIVTLKYADKTLEYGYDTGFKGDGAVMSVNLPLPAIVQVADVNLNKTYLQMRKGQTAQLTATVTPSNATVKTITWKSSSPQTVSVDQSGRVTAKAPGTASITACGYNGRTAFCTVAVGCFINYQLNKGSNSKSNPQYCDNTKVSLKSPSRKGYAFKGWYTTPNFKKKISVIPASLAKDLTVYAKWSKVSVKKAAITGIKNLRGRKVQVKLKKLSGVHGYELIYSTNSKLKKGRKLIRVKKNAATLKKLAKNKKYYVKARGYRMDSTGKKVYGAYSSVRSVTIKK